MQASRSVTYAQGGAGSGRQPVCFHAVRYLREQCHLQSVDGRGWRSKNEKCGMRASLRSGADAGAERP